MGWLGHCSLMKIFKWFVLFINFLLVGIGDLPHTSNNLQKNFKVKKTRPSFPHTMRLVHMYVKLASSGNFLWPKLEWTVLWSLPLYFLSCKYVIFHSSHLYPPALSTLLSYLGSFNMNYIAFRIIEIFKTYLFKKELWKKVMNVLICTRIFCFYLKSSK